MPAPSIDRINRVHSGPGAVLSFQVGASGQGKRLDQFLHGTGKFASRHQVQQLIGSGFVRVNDAPAKPSQRLKPADHIRVELPPPAPSACLPEAIPLLILYEDEHLLVVDKPAGMVVHPAAGHSTRTLVHALLFHCKDLSGVGGVLRPGIVHRLDKGTSGLLVVAKTDEVHCALSRQFQAHSILREYVGLVHGTLRETRGRVESPIGRHVIDRKRMSSRTRRGKDAVTHWEVARRFPSFTLVRFRLETGRTHQIRVHMAEQGHPIAGDTVYGSSKRRLSMPRAQEIQRVIASLGRLFLHAEKLGFLHPTTGERLAFSSPLPHELDEILASLERFEPS
ncbi:MAG: RluA family pseudouridine synthase [bacterium]